MMEYRGYHAWIRYSDEDRMFVGEVFGINDRLGFHGTSVEELEKTFHQAVDNYLEMCKEFGKEPEKEYKGKFNVRIPPMLHRAAAYYAKQQEMSLNEFVIVAIRNECTRMGMQA
ncbi:MAG: type II toxin-antitoxin system HicB family antitoxin [Lachnospiraceae bacterium]|nr:type II toxin-antitoxin system HicB family antitoxin [Sarcina sp.]MBQ6590188.1 type II toxin-antitoxin system HicB family antitoxin [Lachnospiraceae bacterium]